MLACCSVVLHGNGKTQTGGGGLAGPWQSIICCLIDG